MWRIGWAPNNASKWQVGFNSAFKGLILYSVTNQNNITSRGIPVRTQSLNELPHLQFKRAKSKKQEPSERLILWQEQGKYFIYPVVSDSHPCRHEILLDTFSQCVLVERNDLLHCVYFLFIVLFCNVLYMPLILASPHTLPLVMDHLCYLLPTTSSLLSP